MTPAQVAITPAFLAVSTRDDHDHHLRVLAETAWTHHDQEGHSAATSPDGHLTLVSNRDRSNEESHLTLAARSGPRSFDRWQMVIGGLLPVEFLASVTGFVTAELLRDPDHVIFGLDAEGRLATLPRPYGTEWEPQRNGSVALRVRHRGAETRVIVQPSDAEPPLLPGGRDTRMMIAATVPGRDGARDLLWWACFSTGTPPAVMGTFVHAALSPEPVIRPGLPQARPDLHPLLSARPVTGPVPGTIPPGRPPRPGPSRGGPSLA